MRLNVRHTAHVFVFCLCVCDVACRVSARKGETRKWKWVTKCKIKFTVLSIHFCDEVTEKHFTLKKEFPTLSAGIKLTDSSWLSKLVTMLFMFIPQSFFLLRCSRSVCFSSVFFSFGRCCYSPHDSSTSCRQFPFVLLLPLSLSLDLFSEMG